MGARYVSCAAILFCSVAAANADILTAPRVVIAPPITQWEKVETWGWAAEIPAGWKEILKLKNDPKRLYNGKWGYRSSDKSFRIKVKIRPSEGLPWKERTKQTYAKLYKQHPEMKLISARSVQLNKRDTFILFASIQLKRKLRTRSFLIYRMLVRFPKQKLRATLTFLGADDRLLEMEKIVLRFTETFRIVEPDTADKALDEIRQNGIGVE